MLLWEQHELFDCLKSATPISSSPKLHSGTWRSHTSRRPEREAEEVFGERERKQRQPISFRILLQNTSNTWYTLQLLKISYIDTYLEIWHFFIATKEFFLRVNKMSYFHTLILPFSMFFFPFLTFTAAHKQFSSIHSSYEICTVRRRSSTTLYLM